MPPEKISHDKIIQTKNYDLLREILYMILEACPLFHGSRLKHALLYMAFGVNFKKNEIKHLE